MLFRSKSAFILFFYPRTENCSDCEKQRLVLTSLRGKYGELRVYAFDYSTELSAVKAMLQIYKIKDTETPALVIDDELLIGFRSVEELEVKVKESFKLQETTPEEDTDKSS